jgi:hypothetical protein
MRVGIPASNDFKLRRLSCCFMLNDTDGEAGAAMLQSRH